MLRLDHKPDAWEEHVSWFCAFLIDNERKSATIKSYISGLKTTLTEDGYRWDDTLVTFSSLIKACKVSNDVIKCRLPIHKRLLEILLFEVERIFNSPYLITLYRAIILLCYYGMMRVGELTEGDHTLKAANIHIGSNKDKILIILYTSKTHSRANHPQNIKISSSSQDQLTPNRRNTYFCPFKMLHNFLAEKGNYTSIHENLCFL